MTEKLKKFIEVLVSRGAGTVLQFLAFAFAGNYFGAATVGAIGAAQAFTLVFGAVACGGSPLFILRRTALPSSGIARPQSETWMKFGHFWVLLMSALTIILLLIFGQNLSIFANISKQGQFDLGLSIVLITGILPYALAKMYFEKLKGGGSPSLALFLEFAVPFIFIGLMLAIATQYPSSATALVYIGFPLAFWTMALCLIIFHKPASLFLKSFRRNFQILRQNSGELASLLSVNLGNALLLALPILIATSLLDWVSVGGLTVVMKIIGASTIISTVIIFYYSRQLVSDLREMPTFRRRQTYWNMTMINFLANVFFLIPIMLFPEKALSFFGAQIATDEMVVAILTLAGLRLVKCLLGTPQIFLALSGNSRFDLLGFLVALVSFAVILISLGVSVTSLVWAAGTASVVRTIASLLFVILRVMRE